jgi:putative ABC transport system permease protein
MAASRAMFWRILRRQVFANRGRLFVVLLALMAGAAITAALLNLQVDAKRRLTTEFRALGPNVIITPRDGESAAARVQTLPEKYLDRVTWKRGNASVDGGAPFLYAVASVSGDVGAAIEAVVVGTLGTGRYWQASKDWKFAPGAEFGPDACFVGVDVRSRLKLRDASKMHIQVGEKSISCQASSFSAGDPEDNQIFVPLTRLQDLASLPGQVSMIQVHVEGNADDVESYADSLRQKLPDVEVHEVRQFAAAQQKIYNKISGLLTATVVLVLILTALCVLAAMTNVAMERRNDVGLMKAIGGATRRVARLFLTEAALLGLVGGLLGAALGILLSMELGKAVFGVAARPRLIVYPIAVGLTVLVSIVSAYPLRRLASVRPANVFRGEA